MAKVLRTEGMGRCIGCFSCMLMCAGVNRKNHSTSRSAIAVQTRGGMSGKFVAVVCQACHEPKCAAACPTEALVLRQGGGVTVDEEKCIACRNCVDACNAQAVGWDDDINAPIICRHCGACTRFCPHNCLAMEEVASE